MDPWPRYPRIYEINTWVWLGNLGARTGTHVTLATVPDEEWDTIASWGFDAVWLMGVWERSPAGIAVSMRNEGLVSEFRRALPDFHDLDNVGSAYCVRRYEVDEHLGGRQGLARARAKLAERGMRLLLDFIPNHVAPDHPWVSEHREYFVQGSPWEAQAQPRAFIEVDGGIFACGRDPNSDPWPDVLQLDAFHAGLRGAMADTLLDVASQCDGVRCDMAMLVINSVFERTWCGRVGRRPGSEYWEDIVPAVRRGHPDFFFIAEAYWDLEWELQHQGFDYCYDKRLYDRLEHGTAEEVRLHLGADLAFQSRLLRFIENHDEPRAATAFAPARLRAAALVAATLPGARLWHEGQFKGRRIKVPVFLGTAPTEPVDEELQSFYRKLLASTDALVFRQGLWRMCPCEGWPDNPRHQNVLAWCWALGDERRLVVVNLSETPSQARVRLPWNDLVDSSWEMADDLSGDTFEREGAVLQQQGLYVELDPWRWHFLRLQALARRSAWMSVP